MWAYVHTWDTRPVQRSSHSIGGEGGHTQLNQLHLANPPLVRLPNPLCEVSWRIWLTTNTPQPETYSLLIVFFLQGLIQTVFRVFAHHCKCRRRRRRRKTKLDQKVSTKKVRKMDDDSVLSCPIVCPGLVDQRKVDRLTAENVIFDILESSACLSGILSLSLR